MSIKTGSIKTGKVRGRRELRFESLADILSEAQRIAAAETITMLGNWTPGQVFAHLACVMQNSIDGFSMQAPWFIRWLVAMRRQQFLSKPMPSGFQLPKQVAKELVAQESIDTDEALAKLRGEIRRLGEVADRRPHPALGTLTRDQWDQLHMRHAEMHMSFLLPQG